MRGDRDRSHAAKSYVQPKKTIRRFTPEELATATELFEKGLSYTEVGRKLQRDPSSLRNRFPQYKGNSAPAGGAW